MSSDAYRHFKTVTRARSECGDDCVRSNLQAGSRCHKVVHDCTCSAVLLFFGTTGPFPLLPHTTEAAGETGSKSRRTTKLI